MSYQGYGLFIDRDEDEFGYHVRSRQDIEALHAMAPLPPGTHRNKMPKQFRNGEGVLEGEHERWEYPAVPWDYAAQNSRGVVNVRDRHGNIVRADQGHTRYITDARGTLEDVIYHPPKERRAFRRAVPLYNYSDHDDEPRGRTRTRSGRHPSNRRRSRSKPRGWLF